ncbi:MAG: hypothetical protein JWM57_942 [Phycisphaerales bacterium]|nr:hypothetical protein [Phycisphaerales bacterium]
MLDPIQLSLVLLLAAAVVLYAGTRLLWASISSAGLWRGVIIGLPLILLATVQSTWSPGSGVALLVSASVLVMTLGLGVSTIDLPAGESGASPVLRTLLPLTATVCLAGFHGELTWLIGLGVAAVGLLTLWTADGARQPLRVRSWPLAAIPAAILLITGLAILVTATNLFRHASGSAAPTPVIVLLMAPAVLLALLGLLSAEGRQQSPDVPQETATGVAIACLGLGVPTVIGVGTLWPRAIGWISPYLPSASKLAATQPADWPAVVMPLSTWRVDSVLLVVASVMLLPIGAGRFRLGRVEGIAFILLYLAYAAVATRTGSLAG